MSASAKFVRNGRARQAFSSSGVTYQIGRDHHVKQLTATTGIFPVRHASAPTNVHSAYLRRNTRNLPPRSRALAILLLHRTYATDTSPGGGGASGFPPPGFNAEEARKPLPPDENKKASEQKAAPNVAHEVASEADSSVNNQTTTGKIEGYVT